MSLVTLLANLPIDLGQGSFAHKTTGKLIGFKQIPVPHSGAKALDLGCGDGYWSEKLKALGYKTISIDIEREFPNVDADHPYKGMIPLNANRDLPFPNNSFDVIWCSEVIEHLDNARHAAKEIQRLVKPMGVYVVTTPNSFFWLHYLLKLFGLSNPDWQNKGHKSFFSIADMKELFPQADIYGYFPYILIKAKIKNFVSFLSPTFVVVGRKPSN